MFDISQFLDKFKNLYSKKLGDSEKLKTIIDSTLGMEIPKESIQLDRGVLRITASPALKTEIFMKRDELLKALQAEGVQVTEVRG